MSKFAQFDEHGFAIAFYDEALHGQKQIPVYGQVPEPTEDEPDPVAPIIRFEINPNCGIPADAIEISEDQWLELVEFCGIRKWQDGTVVPFDPPAPEPVIPDRLSRRQFRLALIDAGLLEQVETWVSSQDIRTQAAYADSSTFLRTDEMLQQGFSGLGFTEEQINQFFTDASIL